MTYLILLFIAFVSLYVSKSCLIWILRERYKDTYISLGSPSMLSQYPFFVFGLIFSSDFKKMKKAHQKYAYFVILSIAAWSVFFILAARSLGSER